MFRLIINRYQRFHAIHHIADMVNTRITLISLCPGNCVNRKSLWFTDSKIPTFYQPYNLTWCFRGLLQLWQLKAGFLPGCTAQIVTIYLFAFCSCGRWFCPSCHNKKMVQFTVLLCIVFYFLKTRLYPLPNS